MKIEPRTLKGFRDFLPADARKRQYVINTLKKVFESYGFEPLETPTLEYEEILSGKYGEEGDKLMYRFTDQGDRRVAMRYDQTVPLARVVAQYQNDLPLPFKRYQAQNVWRADNTQKGRFREFLQCDIDTVGVDSALADAEVIAAAITSLQKLGFENFKILVNDRENLKFSGNDIEFSPDQNITIVRSIDKLKKIGPDGVRKELQDAAFSDSEINLVFQTIDTMKPTPRLKETFAILEQLGKDPQFYEFSPTLARGLDYYTGLIIEGEIENYTAGSVLGGGRYDKLIGMFSKDEIPAVGFAFGFDRVMEALDEFDLFPADLKTSQVLVTIFSPELIEKSVNLSSKLRASGIAAELYLDESVKMEKQLKYADKKQIPYVAILGSEEAKKNVVTLKDLKTGSQQTLPLDKVIDILQNK